MAPVGIMDQGADVSAPLAEGKMVVGGHGGAATPVALEWIGTLGHLGETLKALGKLPFEKTKDGPVLGYKNWGRQRVVYRLGNGWSWRAHTVKSARPYTPPVPAPLLAVDDPEGDDVA